MSLQYIRMRIILLHSWKLFAGYVLANNTRFLLVFIVVMYGNADMYYSLISTCRYNLVTIQRFTYEIYSPSPLMHNILVEI